MSERELLHEVVIQPGTGKALELRRGQVLRIEQVDGGQCADFNCFNLHDYKEYFHTGRTRHMHGLHPTTGDFLWSAPPRDRPIAAIIGDTLGANDIMYARCSAFLYDFHYGLTPHTNCHDIQAEAQRQYGLTPDDVHDSFNFFTCSGVDANGQPFLAPNVSKRDDYVELLALIDLLAVPNVCGADVMATNSFEFKPLRLAVYQSAEEELEAFADRPELRPHVTQRRPRDFRNAQIKVDRELGRDPAYVPDFTNVPITLQAIAVELADDEAELLQRLVVAGRYGATPGEALRYVFHSWWIARFMQGPKHFRPESP